MKLEETIYKRQSCRTYNETPLDEQTIDEIKTFIQQAKVLNDNIKWDYDIVTNKEVKSLLRWKAPHHMLLFSEEKENYKENIGFIFQQLDLYLQSRDIGSCWLGMVSPNSSYKNKNPDLSFIITISFGKSTTTTHRKIEDFNRKKLEEITDTPDEKLKPAQYAPSATNSQPWYFTHNTDGSYNVYREKLGFIKKRTIGKWNPIDIGIALAQLYIANKDTFEFMIKENPQELKDYLYMGTFEI